MFVIMKEPNVNFGAALIKIASRCNLNCDYCYMYQHEDQSWKSQPKLISTKTVTKIAERINDYIQDNELDSFDIIFHGGEPLLYKAENIIAMVQIFKSILRKETNITYSLQTNGTLLNEKNVALLFGENVSISVSLDGPKEYNDLHRLDFNKNSTFDEVINGIDVLKSMNSELFSGVIAVIDPRTDPKKIFEFIDELDVPKFDLLLPDATHKNPPFLRSENPNIYIDWLNQAYDIWFKKYSHIPVRWFDAILATRVGIPSDTDAMGFGSVNLLVIETDGSYTDHDVLKITQPEGAKLDLSVYDSSIEDVRNHPQIRYHGELLKKEGLSDYCKKCPIVDACGGGSVPHRYDVSRQFDMPTVYCKEIFAIMSKSAKLLRESIKAPTDFDIALTPSYIKKRSSKWRTETDQLATKLGNKYQINTFDISKHSAASLFLNLQNDTPLLYSEPMAHEHFLGKIRIQNTDKVIQQAYESLFTIVGQESKEYKHFINNKIKIERYLKIYSPDFIQSMSDLISDIIICEANTENPGIFSFSDDQAPNIIYLSTYDGGVPLQAEDMADSIIHEYLHQVLYHLDRDTSFLSDYEYPQFSAPWREGSRSSNGFLHGTFVFSHLSKYWEKISKSKGINLDKAIHNSETFKIQALYGISSLHHFSLLTPAGKELIQYLLRVIEVETVPSLETLQEMMKKLNRPILKHKS